MRFNTFDQVAEWYNNTKPLGGKDNKGLDIRPIGARRYKYERIKKCDEDTYALIDGYFDPDRGNDEGQEEYALDMTAFSQCYVQLSMIKSQQASQQAALEQQQREAKKANDLQKAEILLKIAEQGFGMAAGNQPARQGIAGPTITPITPITPFRFVTPSGNSYNCSTFGVTLTCR
ncbi:hypothetical protein [Shewanella sp.]|uniref:hypothetical protein n=1 Tax=Shewanella sp. TaxID=50422 RepID=UPI004047C002